MKRSAVGLLTLLTLAPIAEGVDPKSVLFCEILAHPEGHMGRRVIVHGAVVHYEHGTYLVATPPCDQGHSGIPIQGTFAAAYGKGVKVLATVEGELVISKVGIPQFTQTPYLAFSAKKVRYEGPQGKSK
jgi:hypothetical protein